MGLTLFYDAVERTGPSGFFVVLLCTAMIRISLVLLAAAVLSRALRRASAAVQHRVWLLAILGLLAVPLCGICLPAWHVPGVGIILEPTGPLSSVGSGHVSPSITTSATWSWTDVLCGCWVLGAIVQLGRIAISARITYAVIRASRLVEDSAWRNPLQVLQTRAGIRRRVSLRETARSMSPAAWGLLRPVIVLPAASNRWSSERRHCVLLHELAHIQRHDCLWQTFAGIACAIWWFHPLAWYVAARLRATAEQAADDFVILAGEAPARYAEELLAIASSLRRRGLPGTAVGMVQRSKLETRLAAILDSRRPRGILSRRASIASSALFGGAMVLMSTLSLVAEQPAALADGIVPPMPAQSASDATSDRDFAPRESSAQHDTAREKIRSMITANGELQLRYVLPTDQPNLPATFVVDVVPIPAPAELPRAATQLIPNWDTSQNACVLLPAYVPGMAQILLLQQPGPTAQPHLQSKQVEVIKKQIEAIKHAAQRAAD